MTKINLKPTAGYLLIEPLEKEVKTVSGIYLPENAGEKPQKGKVLAMGPTLCACEDCKCSDCKCENEAPCKVGDIVLYKKWGTNDVKIEGKEYMFVKLEDILAVEI